MKMELLDEKLIIKGRLYVIFVDTKNHYSNLEIYEFSHPATFMNAALFYTKNAEVLKLKCTLFGGKKLEITVNEDEQYKSQYLEMSDCQGKLAEALTKMIQNPLKQNLLHLV